MRRQLALAALFLALLAACGGKDGAGPAADGSTPATPSARTTAVSGGQAADYILAEDELPDGWRHASGEQHLGVPKMCGVTLEPPDLSSAETQRFTRGFSGPFVIQYSFVSADEATAEQRVDEFVAAAETCTTYEPGNGVTIAVSPITDVDPVGDVFAAVRGQNTTVEGNDQEFVVFRNGPVVTVLQSYSPATLADHAALSDMAAAISAKQN